MTLVTLDELLEDKPLLTVPEHPAAELMERHGYYEETVNNRRHYVTKDDQNRAVLGPKRHRARSLFGLGRKRRAPEQAPGTLERTITTEDVRQHVNETLARTAKQIGESITTVDFGKLGTYLPTPPPPQKVGMLKKTRNWFTERFYDEEWHKGAQRTAGTILLWGFTIASLVVFVKGILWVVTL